MMYSMKGAKAESEILGVTWESQSTLNYLEIPINVVAGIGDEEGQFQIFAGPYVGIGLFGKVKAEIGSVSDESDIQFVGDYVDADSAKIAVAPFDYGLNFGMGFKMNNIQVQAGYGLGLGNLIPKTDGEAPDDKNTNSVIQVTIAFLIGGE